MAPHARRRAGPLEVTGDHVRVYKRALREAGARSGSIARYLSVIRGVYRQLAIHGLVPWDVARDIVCFR